MTILEMEQCEQRSIEWHQSRWGCVGGTGLGNLMGTKVAYEKVVDEIVGCRTEEFEYSEGFVNEAMQYGLDMEPEAFEYSCDLTGNDYKEFGWLSSNIDISGCSPDGVTDDRKKALEIKAPSRHVHQSYIRLGVVPRSYFYQCVNYFSAIPSLEELLFMSYRPSNIQPHFCVTWKRDTVVTFGKLTQTVQEFVDGAQEVLTKASKEINERVEEIKQSVNEF